MPKAQHRNTDHDPVLFIGFDRVQRCSTPIAVTPRFRGTRPWRFRADPPFSRAFMIHIIYDSSPRNYSIRTTGVCFTSQSLATAPRPPTNWLEPVFAYQAPVSIGDLPIICSNIRTSVRAHHAARTAHPLYSATRDETSLAGEASPQSTPKTQRRESFSYILWVSDDRLFLPGLTQMLGGHRPGS